MNRNNATPTTLVGEFSTDTISFYSIALRPKTHVGEISTVVQQLKIHQQTQAIIFTTTTKKSSQPQPPTKHHNHNNQRNTATHHQRSHAAPTTFSVTPPQYLHFFCCPLGDAKGCIKELQCQLLTGVKLVSSIQS